MSKEIRRFERSPQDLSAFHSWEEFEHAPPLTFAIEGFLQNDGITLISGLAGHGKTLILLSMVKALFSKPGTKLWGQFRVNEQASRVIYLIPESGITLFKHRLKIFGLYRYVRDGLLLVRTLSKGPAPKLDEEAALLRVAAHSHVCLDSVVRFGEGDEDSASDNQKGLARYIFRFISAGAKTVVGVHHSPKIFANQHVMTLENMLRGSGDIGAMPGTAWGIKQIDAAQNVIHIENIKPRDFQPCGPFQIIGRPHIDEEGDFRMHKKPGECGTLVEELGSNRRTANKRTTKKEKAVERVMELVKKYGEGITDKEIIEQFKENKWGSLAESTARKHRSDAIECLNAKRGKLRMLKRNA
jgi:hypothetical protein